VLKMKNENELTNQEKIILKVLYEENRDMSIKEIAKKTGMSWKTVKKYIEILEKKGVWDDKKKS